MESIQQSYVNTVNELNQELLAIKEAYEQVDSEKQLLNSELEKRSADTNQQQFQQTIGNFASSYITLKSKLCAFQKKYHHSCLKRYASFNLVFHLQFDPLIFQVPIHTSGIGAEREAEELQQLRENFAILTTQYAQLDEANRAWQLYHQTQLETFKNKLHGYLPVAENVSFDDIAQQIVDQITKERESFAERNAELEQGKSDLRSGSLRRLSIHQFIVFICRISE